MTTSRSLAPLPPSVCKFAFSAKWADPQATELSPLGLPFSGPARGPAEIPYKFQAGDPAPRT